jgi:hypothetical protein
MKALILVMSARRSPWGALMDASRETWDSEAHPQTQTLYYCGKNTGEHLARVFYSRLSEHLHDLSARTIEALAHSLTIPDWDFLVRPNSSCYVHKVNLVKHLETLPTSGLMQGLVTTGFTPNFMWGGGQYIFSRDVVTKMLENRHKWNERLQEDEALSRLAVVSGVEMNGNGRLASIDNNKDGTFRCLLYGGGESFVFTDFADMRKADGHFFFREKQDHDRTQDVRIMHELKRHLP